MEDPYYIFVLENLEQKNNYTVSLRLLYKKYLEFCYEENYLKPSYHGFKKKITGIIGPESSEFIDCVEGWITKY